MSGDTTDYDELKKLAEAASVGPWTTIERQYGKHTIKDNNGWSLAEMDTLAPNGPRFKAGKDAAFIAAANPETILALIAELKEAREALEPFAEARLVSWGKRSEQDDWFHVKLKLRGDPNVLTARAAKALAEQGGADD